jgi:hypothetical protein
MLADMSRDCDDRSSLDRHVSAAEAVVTETIARMG